MAWQPLSRRQVAAQADGPYEGVPGHLKYPLIVWLRGRFGLDGHYAINENLLREIAIRFRTVLPLNVELRAYAAELIRDAAGGDDSYDVDEQDEDLVTNHEFFLDLVDATLYLQHTDDAARTLDRLLSSAASVWRVSDDHASLTRIVNDEAQATFNAATSNADEITKELKEAWANAFGRNGDPSDAWDHAIKALEDLLIPIVVPNQSKPNLGHVIGQLRTQGSLWRFILPGQDRNHDVAPLVGMLDAVWPNHDRHGGGQSPKRVPSIEEARAVVTLAATIVQLHREGGALYRRL